MGVGRVVNGAGIVSVEAYLLFRLGVSALVWGGWGVVINYRFRAILSRVGFNIRQFGNILLNRVTLSRSCTLKKSTLFSIVDCTNVVGQVPGLETSE